MTPAPRHIPATAEDLAGWCVPFEYLCRPGDTGPNDSLDGWESAAGSWPWLHHPDSGRRFLADDVSRVRLDTRRPEVRDHLIRRYALPDWHRDTPGGLTPEQSAAVVLGSVLRVRAGLKPIRALAQRRRAYHYAVLAGDPTLLIGINASEEDVLVRGGSLLTPTGILLPPLTPGGEPVLWSTP